MQLTKEIREALSIALEAADCRADQWQAYADGSTWTGDDVMYECDVSEAGNIAAKQRDAVDLAYTWFREIK